MHEFETSDDPLPTLSIAIATIGDRVRTLDLPPFVPDIDYVVCVQHPQEAPAPSWANRKDVQILPQDSTGVSRNRTAGLTAATGDLVLFSDDDIELCPDGIKALRQAFLSDADLVLAMGWRTGRMPKQGTRAKEHRLTIWNTGRACPPEFMVRRIPLITKGITFDPDFGVGSQFPLGEEYAFVSDILQAGLKGCGFPVEMGRHEHASSGDDWENPSLNRARAALLNRVFGKWSRIVRLVFAWRHRVRFASYLGALRFAFGLY